MKYGQQNFGSMALVFLIGTGGTALLVAAGPKKVARAYADERGEKRSSRVPQRVFEYRERLEFLVPPGVRELRVWLPAVAEESAQSADLLSVESPWPHRLTEDPIFGNRFVYLEAVSPSSEKVVVEARYRVRRRERSGADGFRRPVESVYTEPRGLLVIDDEIRRIARKITGSLRDPYQKAKAIYYYVLSRMDYDKSGDGWGRGDVAYACRVGKGNCTDFHSLFMALVMAEEIPARFRMGAPLPAEPQGHVTSYHCWAEFFVEGLGWTPVDVSEAWKNPSRADYYFGNLDENRLLISTGRELWLTPRQEGQPLNFLFNPYIEVNGRPFQDFQISREYKNAI